MKVEEIKSDVEPVDIRGACVGMLYKRDLYYYTSSPSPIGGIDDSPEYLLCCDVLGQRYMVNVENGKVVLSAGQDKDLIAVKAKLTVEV